MTWGKFTLGRSSGSVKLLMNGDVRGEEVDVDRAVAIRPPHVDAARAQRLDDAGVRMAESVVQSARDQGDTRMDRVEKCWSGRRAASVMADLEHIGSDFP